MESPRDPGSSIAACEGLPCICPRQAVGQYEVLELKDGGHRSHIRCRCGREWTRIAS